MANIFNSVQYTRPGRNVFDLSHDFKLSGKMGFLIPTLALDCVPGDKINIGSQNLLRFAPMIAPIMHRCDVYMHYFFVPNRLLWDRWTDWITNNGELPEFPTLQFTNTDYPLADYLGIPRVPGGTPSPENVSALPFSAYQFIVNEYYRDQNLQAAIPYQCVAGNNNANLDLLRIRRRAWEHDYFTSALPFAQKGQPVTIPIGELQDIRILRNQEIIVAPTVITPTSGTSPLTIANAFTDSPTVGDEELYADTSNMVGLATTINDFRRAEKLQEWLEKAARAGSRYTENILAFFGVKSPDSRLDRPEYITGIKSPVIISEVLNTTGTDDAPQGNMAGHGYSIANGKFGKYYCQEHGYIMGIMSVMPKTAYQQGIPKHFLKTNSPNEYFWPQFEHIGEQPITLNELWAFGNDAATTTFGYTPRYAEYKFMQNRVAGEFRTSLDFWHLGRIFDSVPQLNSDFIECIPSDRIWAVQEEGVDNFYCTILHKIRAVRSMSKYGSPY